MFLLKTIRNSRWCTCRSSIGVAHWRFSHCG